MNERAVSFGSNQALLGVWCAPARLDRTRPALIMINSGIIHHAGVWRLHVRLARTLANHGFGSLRFDLSGIGDSDNLATAENLETQVQDDIKEAIAHVRRDVGIDRVVLMGLCSGARDSLDGALLHEEVVGFVAVDLVADIQTWQHFAVHYGRRLFRPQSWKNALTRRDGALVRLLTRVVVAGDRSEEQEEVETPLGIQPRLGRDALRRHVADLTARNVEMLFLFSSGLEFNYNHRLQFRNALPEIGSSSRVAVDYFPGVDHTFSEAAQQARLIRLIDGWMVEHFESESSEPLARSVANRARPPQNRDWEAES